MKEQIIGWFVIIIWIMFIISLFLTNDVVYLKTVAISYPSYHFFKMICKALKK